MTVLKTGQAVSQLTKDLCMLFMIINDQRSKIDGVYGHSTLARLRTDKAYRQEAMEDSL